MMTTPHTTDALDRELYEEEPVVRVVNAKRHYTLRRETVRALDGVSLTVDAGDFIAIAGPSGSGKSTLLNLIGALDQPTEGEILVEGRRLSSLSARQRSDLRRDRIGFVFQTDNLLPVMTAAENVEYVLLLQGVGRAERTRRVRETLRDVGLLELAARYPAEMSGGQRQRVAVARAIVGAPSLVVADEPTANLDTATASSLLDLMQRLNQVRGVTFVFSTHDALIMKRAHRVVRLRDGRPRPPAVTATDRPEETQ